MIKNLAQLEVKINERIYNLTCSNDSPLEHVKEALFQFQKIIGQIEDNAKVKEEVIAENPNEEKICPSQAE